ncbi:MAG: HAD family hydrolase [Nitrososphaerales archaeon]
MTRIGRGLILDLFGVLVSGNSRTIYEELVLKPRLAIDYGVWSDLYTKASSGDIDYRTFVENLAAQISILPDVLESKLEDVISKSVGIINSGDSFISRLRKTEVPFVILTNSISAWVEIILGELMMRGLTSRTIISSAIRVRKPQPKAYLLAAEAVGRRAQDLVYVGDENEDMKGAKDVGMYCVFIAGEDQDSPSCDHQISELSDIFDLSSLRLEP